MIDIVTIRPCKEMPTYWPETWWERLLFKRTRTHYIVSHAGIVYVSFETFAMLTTANTYELRATL